VPINTALGLFYGVMAGFFIFVGTLVVSDINVGAGLMFGFAAFTLVYPVVAASFDISTSLEEKSKAKTTTATDETKTSPQTH